MANNIKNSKADEWRHKLLLLVSGILVFETITGLLIYFLPFTISNQVNVLVHSIVGVVFIVPYVWYQIRHWLVHWEKKMNHFKLTGYVLMVLTTVLVVSGVVLTYQALFSVKIEPGWRLTHIITTFAFVAFFVTHIVFIMIRDYKVRHYEVIVPILKAERQFGWQLLGVVVFLGTLVVIWTISYQPITLNNKLPDDYSYLYGEDRPFAPSLATTSTGGAFDTRSLSQSEGCGTTNCHQEIYDEWQVSAHRYSAMDVGFQKVQSVMGEQNGPESTRYCGGCHDPISLFSGNKNIYTAEDDLTTIAGYQEGISCIACHAIKETDIKGNANYVMTQPKRYLYELKEGRANKVISDFLIRSYPDYHKESFQHKMFKSPEFCAACHKQFIDEEVNNVGWVQLQNQYDNWRKSRWNTPGDPTETIECRECHMPLVAGSLDPGSGDDLDYNRMPDDNKHRSHRFLAANQFMPVALGLPGGEEHARLTEKWLRGEIEIPEIADKWEQGPAVPIELVLPEDIKSGDPVKVQVLITNNKVGHDFPTGPIDIIQAWVELRVTDQDGQEIFTSGELDEKNFVQPGSFIFKVEPVDQYGNLIDKHNLWEMVGVRFRRAMFPGFSDQAEYTFACPTFAEVMDEEVETKSEFEFATPNSRVTELNITAKLKYRKFDQYLLNYLFGEESGISSTVTVISEDRKTIKVI
jgi:Cytochrome c554 and c-prime